MCDPEFLKLLSEKYPTPGSAAAEIIRLQAVLELPKGTEYFFSDLHGEYKGFSNLLRSSSGVIRSKISDAFGDILSSDEQKDLSHLICWPEKVLPRLKREGKDTPEWQRITISRLVTVCRVVSVKYTRNKVRKKIPADYAHAIDELLHQEEQDPNKKLYYKEIVNAIVDVGSGPEFIATLSRLIRDITIDSLHIIGDIYDRGPRPDMIMDELMNAHDVDIEWGNHDVSWMGAAAGNEACIATVLRIGISYNSFDMLEDGYGINLRQLSMFAAEVYGDDPCECFLPHLLDYAKYDAVSASLAAKMSKAITIIGLKAEGQLIRKHPEYGLEKRLLLDMIDYSDYTVTLGNTRYPMKDKNFPTIDPADPYRFSKEERELLDTLRLSFMHSQRLREHIRFLYTHGSLYRICNGNLLYHGCIPMKEDGSFAYFETPDGAFGGKGLMDYLDGKIREAWYLDPQEEGEKKQNAADLLWYLWCGPLSPLFGKDRMATFEGLFLEDPKLKKEVYNPYFRLIEKKETAERILTEFGMPTGTGHIINGHVPVKVKKGESPVKAGGKLFVIDGGMSKAYQKHTGIAGYTLIYNSHHLALAAHKPYSENEENMPEIEIVEELPERMLIKDTDAGKEMQKKIGHLKELLRAYEAGKYIRQTYGE